MESLGSLLSDCSDRLAADSGGEGDRSIGNGLMELLESVPLIVGGLFIIVVEDDDVDDGGDASNDVLLLLVVVVVVVVVVADLACRRVAVKHRFRNVLI